MSRSSIAVFAIAVSFAAAAAACSKSEAASSPGAGGGGPGVPQESRNIFAQRCATCHGADGKGSGPAAAAMNPKPRNYTDATWQASVTDAQIAKTIVEGGAAAGKSALMPPNPDLAGKPDVVAGLVAIVRSFKR